LFKLRHETALEATEIMTLSQKVQQ